MTALRRILDKFKKDSTNTVEQGAKFEKLTKFFLENDNRYKDRFSKVWLWKHFPENEGKVDTGIDIVAKEKFSDGYCAIQSKFFDEKTRVEKDNIDSFFTASGKKIYTSRLIFVTSNNWTSHAEDALKDQKIPINRISLEDMEDGSIDWEQFDEKQLLAKKKTPNKVRPHQELAIQKVLDGFKRTDRGKLIMACGTGKTFTSLKIAEEIGGIILFLTPSINLVSQTFNEWILQSKIKLNALLVCSDESISAEDDDIRTYDLPIPPTTNSKLIYEIAEKVFKKGELNVIFSTYQSIERVIEAQSHGLPEIDLIICDEAHRTAGVTKIDVGDSMFTLVHSNTNIKAKKRLYMTATPRVYREADQKRASQEGAIVYSMDTDAYGEEFHRLGFGEAVRSDLLCDYKVMVLGVEEEFAKKFLKENEELQIDDDQIKIIGCWNALAKKIIRDNSVKILDPSIDENKENKIVQADYFEGPPMRRAVAFCQRIKDSQRFQEIFPKTIKSFVKNTEIKGDLLECEVEHMDGTMSSLSRKGKLRWLQEDTRSKGNICRIISNAKCLSEGVDVPTLDAVIFLNPKNSFIDVVQCVGRVMRKPKNYDKKYGYIIIPISIPAGADPEKALNDNKKYKVVWDVCQALRSHDDRFDRHVNQLRFSKKSPQIEYGQIGAGNEASNETAVKGENTVGENKQINLDLPGANEWQNAIFAKIAKKCGDKEYWDEWAREIAVIAENHIKKINKILKGRNQEVKDSFEKFIKGLKKNINPEVKEEEAIEMLSQHLITKPVFEALFKDYEFSKKNPVSKSIQKMVDTLDEYELTKEQDILSKFYKDVREKVDQVDDQAGKQDIIKELYEKFFKIAFPRLKNRLGIVYTPIEIVDFIIKSTEYILNSEFKKSFNDKDVEVLDPFTGTGTFITILLQSNIINQTNLEKKYLNEIHANEIVLLAYYIAAINIEEVFHSINKKKEYLNFEGIVLSDTFQMYEQKGDLEEKIFPENNKRVQRQKKAPIKVIIGNPPYSARQESENDDNKNLNYPYLDNRISETYVKLSKAKHSGSMYDSYIRAFRWASDRIKDNGIISFVTNGSFIDSSSADGFRASLVDEFNKLYIFNLRGNANSAGEFRKKEKGNVFGEGTKTPIVISILIKNPQSKKRGEIYYHDIGDYLSEKKKLKIISTLASVENITWKRIKTNTDNDWIKKRKTNSDNTIPVIDDNIKNNFKFFNISSLCLSTARDNWVYNFSKKELVNNVKNLITFYEKQLKEFNAAQIKTSKTKKIINKMELIEDFITLDKSKISWSAGLKNIFKRGVFLKYDGKNITETTYRPYCKQLAYYSRDLNERVYQLPKIIPNNTISNFGICYGISANKTFSSVMIKGLCDYHLISNGTRYLPFYIYENKNNLGGLSLFPPENIEVENKDYLKRENINDELLKKFNDKYKFKISKEDIFYYIYGVLQSKQYLSEYENNLLKEPPRIPFVKDFNKFSRAGKNLSNLHMNYETIEPDSKIKINISDKAPVTKMSFNRINGKTDKTTILFNTQTTIQNIPLEAYEYVVNGKSAIEGIMDQYQIYVDKESKIKNDPNDWGKENNQEDYILNLIKRVITVSVESVKIINSLPPIDEI
jgi:predicted helicase